MSDDIKIEREGPILVCTINRPKDNNSLTPDVFRGLLEMFKEAEHDPQCRVVITRASGNNFSVGADSRDLGAWTDKTLNEVYAENFFGRLGLDSRYAENVDDKLGMNRWAYEMSQIDVPMIAEIRGAAAGGGLALALLHHFRIADETAVFATAFEKLGLSAELGMSCLLPEIVGRQTALEMLIAGKTLSASDALDVGLIDACVPADKLEEETMALANRIAKLPPLGIKASLRAILRPVRETFEQALAIEIENQRALWSSQDFKDGVAELLKRLSK